MALFRRAIPLLVVVAGVAAAFLASPAPSRASCEGIMLPFREYAGEAKRIVIGDVAAVDPSAPWGDEEGRSSRFTLRVLYAVRGQAFATMPVRDVEFSPCADNMILAGAGDRIALALDITSEWPDGPVLVGSVAWLHGGPSYLAAADRVTVADVYALAGLVPPATTAEPAAEETGGGGGSTLALLGAVAVVSIGAALRLRPATA